MISSVAWVPAGVADPHPRKYETSKAEQEMLRMLEGHEEGGCAVNEQQLLDTLERQLHDKIRQKQNLQQQQRQQHKKKDPTASKAINSTAAAVAVAHNLPPELRMDEYSSDEEGEMGVGKLLVGGQTIMMDADDDDDDDDNSSHNHDNHHGERNASIKKKPRGNKGSATDDEDIDHDEVGSSQVDGDHDDDDDDDDDGDNMSDIPDTREYVPVDVEGLAAMGLSGGGDDGIDNDNDDDESEVEDVRLSDDDAILLVAKTEEDFATLEVHVYNQTSGHLYVHHDIPLPAFPLCLAHGQVSTGGTTGNFCAVGSFSTGIEIWNLDVLNALEPSCILGGEDTSAADDIMKLQAISTKSNPHRRRQLEQLARRQALVPGLRPGSHTDAVMALSWNILHRQVLASGSADTTVKLWDVTRAGTDQEAHCNAATFRHHRGKVQSVAWHPKEGTLLATGSYDRTIALLDARDSTSNKDHIKSVKTSADCEVLCWDPFHPEYLTVATEDGMLTCWDVRQFNSSTPLWSFVANDFGVTDISYNTHIPGFLVSCSPDKTVNLWDVTLQQHQTSEPSLSTTKRQVQQHPVPQLCGSKDMCAGKLYAVSFYPSTPWLLGCGGSGGQVSLWDLSEEEMIQNRFEHRRLEQQQQDDSGEQQQQQQQHDDNAQAADFQAMMMMTTTAAAAEPQRHNNNNSRDENSDISSGRGEKKKKNSKHKKAKPKVIRKGR